MHNNYFLEIILFVIFTIVLFFFFRESLQDVTGYGFTRFFAFEFLFAILLLNARYWFYRPLSFRQILSWIIMVNSLVFVISGFSILKKFGESKEHIENTTVLVKEGLYGYIRHPLYASLLLFGWGAFLKNPSIMGVFFGFGLTICLHYTAKREERQNLMKFGEHYQAYIQGTKMFIPFLY